MLKTFKTDYDAFGNEIPGLKPKAKAVPPVSLSLNIVASSLDTLLDYLSGYQQWLRDAHRETVPFPEIVSTPQPGQTPIRFTCEVTLPARDLADVLVSWRNRIVLRRQNQETQKNFQPFAIDFDNGHWGQFSLHPEPQPEAKPKPQPARESGTVRRAS